jgi:methanogenic corrinoid protein MtbC1
MPTKPVQAALLDREAFEKARGIFVPRETHMPTPAVHALAAEVIARLERRHGPHVEAVVPQATIEALCDALVSDRDDAAAELVLDQRLHGMSLDTVYLGYLAAAARRLGSRWEDDLISSAQVTIAAGRIYAIMRGLREVFVSDQTLHADQPRALFIAAPGETHTLGVTMAADFFRRRGWQIDLKSGLSHHEIIAEVDPSSYPIIGLSASSSPMVFPLARLVLSLRIDAPAAWILVSGKIVDLVEDIAWIIDADAAASDAEGALHSMTARMEVLEQRRALSG